MIWIVFAAMVAVALALLMVPLLRDRAKPVDRASYDLAVYKDQLTEIDRDLERGVLTADQAEAARVEIQRRMLAAADAGKTAPQASPRRSMAAAAVVAALVPLLSVGLYGLLGSPQLPDQPHDEARATQARTMADQAQFLQNMVARLADKLEKDPSDGKGWAMMGRSMRVLGRTDEARSAYAKAMKLLPADPQVRLDYAGMLLEGVPQGGTLPPDFVAVMRDVLRIAPDQPDALYFVGLAEAQQGRKDKAKTLWTKLLEHLPEGSEDRAEVIRQIEGL